MSERRKPRIVVVGSLNLDVVVRSSRLPRPGETLTGTGLEYVCGGKGANQAVAAARLGAGVTMIGRVGDDVAGPRLTENLRVNGVDASGVGVTPGQSSGTAVIAVDDAGENAITIVPGANATLRPEDVEAHADVIAGSDVMLLQLEVPMETVLKAMQVARDHGVLTMLDPAPVPAFAIPTELYAADLLSPNQEEALALTGIECVDFATSARAACVLAERGVSRVAIKLGGMGALYQDAGEEPVCVEAFRVRAIDTTAAGDAFMGALAVGWAEGLGREEWMRFATATGALAVTGRGAQPSMPTRDRVEALLGGGTTC